MVNQSRVNPGRCRLKRRTGRKAGVLGLLAAAVLSFGGCAFQEQRLQMAQYAATGRYDLAAAELDKPSVQSLYGENSRLLWMLDRGAVAFALGDDQRAFATWEEADKIMDLWREQPPGETVASWLLNDEVTTYIAAPYEDIYVNAMKMLVNLRLGRIEGGATVEARRAAGKANLLRDRYLKFDSALQQKNAGAYKQAMAQRPKDNLFDQATSGGEFVESPLAAYLSAVIFAKAGEVENQGVAARRLEEIIKAQGRLIGEVKAEDFASMEQFSAEQANVLLVAFAGRGPIKTPERIGPIPIFTYPLYIELPRLKSFVGEVRTVRAVAEAATLTVAPAAPLPPVAGQTAGQPATGQPPAAVPARPVATVIPGGQRFEVMLPLIEDMGRVATVNHEREMPQIYARSIIRATIKSAASTALTEAVRQNNRGSRNGDLAAIGLTLAGLAFVAGTERADLRCWAFLPGQAHVQLLNLPPGTWRVRMEYLTAGGGLAYTSRADTVTVSGSAGELATVIGHYWR